MNLLFALLLAAAGEGVQESGHGGGPVGAHVGGPGGAPADLSERVTTFYEHLQPHPYSDRPYFVVGGQADDPGLPRFGSLSFFPIRLYWTNHHAAILVACGLVFVAFTWLAARRRKSLVARGPLENLLEMVVLFVKDDMVYKTMGEKNGRRFLPLFLTQFCCILVMNLFGILPNFDFLRSLHFPTTATANLMVTGGLALTTFTAILYGGIKEQGLKHFVVGLAPPVHLGDAPSMRLMRVAILGIMYPIEILGMFIKPVALMVRLFANMTGGHLAMLTVYALIYLFQSYAIAPIGVAFNVFLTFLELLVACIQAYIFTYLSILFVNAAVHPEH
jgi:F-type H+-transporting ATPase subunit a